MKPVKVAVFVPCYNEEKRLEKNINLIDEQISKITSSYEMIIVDDNSNDKTKELGIALAKNIKHIIYMRFNKGPSRRENLAEAFKHTPADIIVFMDLDLSADITAVHKLMGYIDQGYDIAVGSRYKSSTAERTFSRKIISRIYNYLIRNYFNSAIVDHQCGFKAFKARRLLPLLDDMGYDKAYTRGWFWDAELLIRAQRKNYKIMEFPVVWKEGKESSFNILRELKMIPYMIKLKKRIAEQ